MNVVRTGNLITGVANATAQVKILEMQKISLVEAADSVENGSRHQHQCT